MFEALACYVGRRLDNESIRNIQEIIVYHTTVIRRNSPRFPNLVPVIFEKRGHIDVVRADMEHDGIQQLIRNAVTRMPGIEASEIAASIGRAFPAYRPHA
jgi:hypothetical protein